MTAQELATCAIEKLPIKVLIFNNGFLGMVRQWQELFYDERYSYGRARHRHPGLREAGRGLRLRRACAASGPTTSTRCSTRRWPVTDVPTVVDFRVHDREGVFPMVPAGRPNDEIVLGPEFSADEQRSRAARPAGEVRRAR